MVVTVKAETHHEICARIIEAVALCRGIDVLDIDRPLATVIDADSVASLWQPDSADRDVNGTVTFDYFGCRITVTSEGVIEATEQ